MMIGAAPLLAQPPQPPAPLVWMDGHAAPLRAVAYSPDGKTLLTADEQGEICAWDVTTLSRIRAFRASDEALLALAASPDGLSFTAAGIDGKIRGFDVPLRAPLFSNTGFSGEPTALAVSADGSLVLSGDSGNLIRLWNPQNLQAVRDFAGCSARPSGVAITKGGEQVLAAAVDGTLRGWLTANAQPTGALQFPPRTPLDPALAAGGLALSKDGLAAVGDRDGVLRLVQWPPLPPVQLVAHGNGVRAVAVSPDGKLAASGALDQTLWLHDLEKGVQLRSLSGQAGGVTALALHQTVAPADDAENPAPPQTLIVSASDTGLLKFWQSEDGTLTGGLGGHVGAIHALDLHAASGRLATVGADKTIRIWRLPVPPQVMPGHSQPITEVVISADGALAATASADNTLGVWNLKTGERLATIADHPQGVRAVALDAAAKTIASGDAQGVVRLIDREKGTVAAQLLAHTGPVSALSFHPDGERLYSTGEDGSFKVWLLPVPPTQTIGTHESPVAAADLSADGKLAATAEGKNVRLFDAASGQATQEWKDLPAAVTALKLSADGARLAAGLENGGLLIWKTADGSLVTALGAHAAAIRGLAWRSDGSHLATACADGSLRQWRLPREPQVLAGHTQSVAAVALSPDGKTLATAAADNTIRLWNTADGMLLRTLAGHAGPVLAVAWKADGAQIASSSADKTVRIWSFSDGAEVKKLDAAQASVSLAFSPSGVQLAVVDGNGARLINIADGAEAAVLAGHEMPITAVAFAPKLDEVVTASLDGTLRLWKAADGAAVRAITHGAPVTGLAVSADGSKLASISADKSLKLWSYADGAALANVALPTAASGTALSAEGKHAAVALDDGGAMLFDSAGKELERFRASDVAETSIALTAEGATIYVGSADNQVRILRYALVSHVDAHPGGANAVAWSPDGMQLLSGGADNRAVLWNAATGQLVTAFAGHTAASTAVAFAKAGDVPLVLSAGLDNMVRVWTQADGQPWHAFTHPSAVRALSVGLDGQRFASAGDEALIRVWDLATKRELERLAGHQAVIRSLALSANGHTLLSASDDKSARLSSLSARAVAAADATKTYGLAMSADGALIATAGEDKLVRLWDADGRPHASAPQLGGSATALKRVAIRPDGRQVAAGGDPLLTAATLHLWDLADGQPPVARSVTLPAAIVALAYSPDGTRVAVSCGDQQIRLIRASDGLVLEAVAAAAPVTDLKFTSDGQSILAGGSDNQLRVYAVSIERVIASADAALNSVRFLLDGKHLAVGGAAADGKGAARVIEIESEKETQTFSGAAQAVTSLAVSTDGQRIAAATADPAASALVWNVADGVIALTLPAAQAARDVRFADEGRRLIVAGDDALVKVYDAQRGLLLEQFPGHTAGVLSVAGDAAGQRIVSGGGDNTARLWRAAVRGAIAAHAAPIVAVAVDPMGETVFTAAADKTLTAWRRSDLSQLVTYEGQADVLRGLAVSPDGKLLLGGGDDQTLRVWSVANGKPLAEIKTPAKLNHVVLAAEGKTSHKVLAAGADNVLRNYALRPLPEAQDGALSFTLVQEGHGHIDNTALMRGGVTVAGLAADGRTAFTVGVDGTLKRWFAASAEERFTLSGHEAQVQSLAYNAVGDRMVSAAADGTARVWDVGEAAEVARFAGHEGGLFAAAFRPDGVVSIGQDQAIRLWDLTGKQGRTIQGIEGSLQTLGLSPDGRFLAVGGRDGAWRYWDLSLMADAPAQTAACHAYPVVKAAFDRAGARLATLDESGKLFIYQPSNGQLLYHQQLPEFAAHDFAWSADGKEIAVAGRDPRVLIVRLP